MRGIRVSIFNPNGNASLKLGCCKHLEFPNGVVVNDKQKIFISDTRALCVTGIHCQGTYLRPLGGEGITNYPFGVGTNTAGEVLIAGNPSNLNLTVFTQDGQLGSALASNGKHAQSFERALMNDGSLCWPARTIEIHLQLCTGRHCKANKHRIGSMGLFVQYGSGLLTATKCEHQKVERTDHQMQVRSFLLFFLFICRLSTTGNAANRPEHDMKLRFKD